MMKRIYSHEYHDTCCNFFHFFLRKISRCTTQGLPLFHPKKTKIALVPKKYCPPSTVQFLASTLLIQLRGSKMELQTTTVAKTEKKERRSI
ncbi:predicted protein [Botrytis cinerea T4]|uniref:Uncharacterized protein n=1 Tax=Botryotinia fuckeliana (strain T4) TaxID=999810 RepID=G2YJ70_BOTF4|nr:predicted protein [Botrytis cinerea T4]